MTKSKILGLLSLPILFSAVLLVGLTIAHIATAPPIEEVVCLIAATTIVVLQAISHMWFGLSFDDKENKHKESQRARKLFPDSFFYAVKPQAVRLLL